MRIHGRGLHSVDSFLSVNSKRHTADHYPANGPFGPIAQSIILGFPFDNNQKLMPGRSAGSSAARYSRPPAFCMDRIYEKRLHPKGCSLFFY
jgi:hypothetical protein